ncbi:MAG: hypothetical protein KGL95_03965, partial [Patescibacteria group bacterium]|nr:hypothetical protein [Patescibacteria group bacterium]
MYDDSIKKIENAEIIEIPWVFDIGYSGKGGLEYGDVNATIKFSTEDVFAVYNRVYSTVNATIYPPDSIKNLYFIIPEEHENLTETLITPSQVEYRINESRSYHS